MTLGNCLFGAVKITKDVDTSMYDYTGYGIGFDSGSRFSHPKGEDAKNVIIFACDLSSSAHSNNRANSILVLGKNFIQGVNGTTIYAEKCILPILQDKIKNLSYLCTIMMMIVIYFVMVCNNINLKQKVVKLVGIYCA